MNFQYIEPQRETLLEGFEEGLNGVSQDEFIVNRSMALKVMDRAITIAFQARRKMLNALHSHGGRVQFEQEWTMLVEQSTNAAAASLARAAFRTAKGVEEFYGVEYLICAARFSENPETTKVKWPIFPTFFPELSAWLLSPVSDRAHQLFNVLGDLYPDDAENHIEDSNMQLYWEQVDLMEMECGDSSMMIFVQGKQHATQRCLYAGLRIYTLSTFIAVLHDEVSGARKKCIACDKSFDSLKACSRCHCVQYCGRECQLDHFPFHKRECKVVWKELYQRYNSDSIEVDITSLVMSIDAHCFPNSRTRCCYRC
jgi:MYND finger